MRHAFNAEAGITQRWFIFRGGFHQRMKSVVSCSKNKNHDKVKKKKKSPTAVSCEK